MKRWIYIIGIIIIIAVAVFVGITIFKNEENKTNEIADSYQEYVVDNIIDEDKYSIKNDTTIQIDIKEDKISPNATLILKRKYIECGHTIKEYKQVSEELVNLSLEELEEKKKDWDVEEFSPLEIILVKEEEGICNEHYVLRPKDGVIAVYKIENGIEQLDELTGISIDYLTQTDKDKIQEGIKVYGREELNSVLEDYE